MRILTFVTQKGGTGKSTLAACLAVAAEEAGQRVHVLDLDPQGTLRNWGRRRASAAPAVALVVDTVEAVAVPAALEALQKAATDIVVIDTAGSDTPATAAAMRRASLCLIPVRPSILDLEASRTTVQSVIRMGRPFAFVLNHCPAGRNIRVTDAGRALHTLGHTAEPPIVSRADYVDAMGLGLGVTEQNRAGKAAAELRALWTWIDHQTKGTDHG
jgi:chromosome partitioning protein